tara:strand:+ start:2034 stop:3071 length:1038 start_codon:yes stop_codon:yes gene_type:complete
MDGKELVVKLDDMKPKFANALPSYCGFNQDHVIRTVLTEVQKSPNLMKCTFNSIAQAALEACSLGLLPNSVQGLAYLVPYGDKCQLIPGYKGLIKLALQSPHVNSITANCVYSTDKLDVEFGLNPKLTHVPNLINSEKGEFMGAYAVANMAKGDPVFEYLPKWRIDEIKAKSKAGRSGPWVSDYESMAKKTAIKSLMKILPLEMDKIELAALKAEDGSAGFEYDLDADAWEYVDGEEQETPETKKLNEKFSGQSGKPKSKNQKNQKNESEKLEKSTPLLEAEGEDGEVASNLSGLQLAIKQLEARAKDKEKLRAFYQLNESKWATELGPDNSNELGEIYDQLSNA